LCFCLLAGFVVAVGCDNTQRGKREIPVNPGNDPLAPSRAVLERYARGEALASEVQSFPKLIEDVKKADAERGAIIEQALADIQKNPAGRAEIAKAALEKIKPSMK
jgi:hypothetical protein